MDKINYIDLLRNNAESIKSSLQINSGRSEFLEYLNDFINLRFSPLHAIPDSSSKIFEFWFPLSD